jgi:hypothetical protein
VAQAPYQIYGPPAAPPQLSQPNPITNSAPAATTLAAATPPAPAASPASKSDLPRILSPMAGTFYKCPAPGEPAFVKVPTQFNPPPISFFFLVFRWEELLLHLHMIEFCPHPFF